MPYRVVLAAWAVATDIVLPDVGKALVLSADGDDDRIGDEVLREAQNPVVEGRREEHALAVGVGRDDLAETGWCFGE